MHCQALLIACVLLHSPLYAQESKNKQLFAQEKESPPRNNNSISPVLMINEFRRGVEIQVASKRDEQIDYLSKIIKLNADESERPALYFRLGELYWEKAKWFYFRSEETSSQEEKSQLLLESKRYQEEALALYERIVKNYPQYDRLDEVLYYLGVSLVDLNRETEAAQQYRLLIQRFPSSSFIPDAWLAIGEYFFNQNEQDKALKAYARAAEQKSSQTFGFALYKQAWCYVNLGQWQSALMKFREVIFYADWALQLKQTQKLSLRREAQKDWVRAYSHVGDPKEAKNEFIKVGGKDHYRQMLESLSELYTEEGQYAAVIVINKELILDSPGSTRHVVYQSRVVDALARLGDKNRTVLEIRELVRLFVQVKQQAQTKELSKEDRDRVLKDLVQAVELAESSVRKLALSYHQEAKKTKNDEVYALAKELYRGYLSLFPDARYAYEMRFFYAEILYQMHIYEDAGDQYHAVSLLNPQSKDKEVNEESGAQGKYFLISLEEAVRSFDKVIEQYDQIEKETKLKTKKEAAHDKSTSQPVSVLAQKIPEVKQKFLLACASYLKHVPQPAHLDELRYKIGWIYYSYQHFSEALTWFSALVEKSPEHPRASYAAELILDMLNAEKKIEALRFQAQQFYDNPKLGNESFKNRIRLILERGMFERLAEKETKKDYLAAAETYLQFADKYKDSELAEQALYNAAVNYAKAGALDKAILQRRTFVKKYPQSKFAIDAFRANIEAFERMLDFEQAAQELIAFAQAYPRDKFAPDALINAAVYSQTLQRFELAEQAYSLYVSRYKEGADKRLVSFSLCELYALQSLKKEQAIHCFQDFIQQFKDESQEQVSHALYAIAQLLKDKAKSNTQLVRAEAAFKESYNSLPLSQRTQMLKEKRAQMALDELSLRLQSYRQLNFVSVENERKFIKSREAKESLATELKAAFESIVLEYQVSEISLAALFSIGVIYDDLLRAYAEMPLPRGLTEHQKNLFRDGLREKTGPIQALAVTAYQNCLHKANELGIYNQWSKQARQRLTLYLPIQYPVLKEVIPSIFSSWNLVLPVSESMTTQEKEQALKRYAPVLNAVKLRQLDSAAALLLTELKKDSRAQIPLLLLAQIELLRHAPDAAIDYAKRVLLYDAEQLLAYDILLDAFFQKTDLPMVRLASSLILKKAPRRPHVYHVLAQALLKEQKVPAAVGQFLTVLGLDSKYLKTLESLAKLSLDFEDYQNAKQYYSRLLELDPSSLPLRIGLAVSLRGIGQFKESEQIYLKILAENENEPYALIDLALLYHEGLGLLENASKYYERYIGHPLVNADPSVLQVRAWLELLKQQMQRQLVDPKNKK